jgi:DNA integrity scanning protein DisA with diadenylate cyclase activity
MIRADRSSVPAADLQHDDHHPLSPPTGPDITTRRLAAPGEGLLEARWLERTDVPAVLFEQVLELAIEIAREGREGRRIGTMFTVGDHEHVLVHSRCLILDPIAGHPPTRRSITDPDLRETIKELAQLDGGFVISSAGTVESAARYFESSLPQTPLPLGFGTRHHAAASITTATNTVAVVVSESSIVRIITNGELVAEILPELWLLRRFVTHVEHPHLVEHRADNVIVVSGTTNPPPQP